MLPAPCAVWLPVFELLSLIAQAKAPGVLQLNGLPVSLLKWHEAAAGRADPCLRYWPSLVAGGRLALVHDLIDETYAYLCQKLHAQHQALL